MLKEQTANLGAVTINFVEGPPSGPPLVLLHGGGDRWQGLLSIIPSLAPRWHLFALDLRGHGKSGRMPGEYRPEHYVADVIAWMEQHLSEPAILFGHSLGGWVALMVAACQVSGGHPTVDRAGARTGHTRPAWRPPRHGRCLPSSLGQEPEPGRP